MLEVRLLDETMPGSQSIFVGEDYEKLLHKAFCKLAVKRMKAAAILVESHFYDSLCSEPITRQEVLEELKEISGDYHEIPFVPVKGIAKNILYVLPLSQEEEK